MDLMTLISASRGFSKDVWSMGSNSILRSVASMFLGHVVTADGLKPDASKVESVLKMERPGDKEAVERLRGTVTYLARYVPKLTDVFGPIASLAQHDVDWMWSGAQEQAFTRLKQLLAEASTLVYFDPSKQLVIQCDASKYGLGSALLQDGRPIAYASRALTDAETRYAVVFALEKWHQFTYGCPILVYSDHKPLEAITNIPLDRQKCVYKACCYVL